MAVQNSFNAIAFGWRPGGPDIKKDGGLIDVWSGEVEIDTKAHFDSLFALLRPVNRRVIAGVSAFVDFFDTGVSPIHTLILITYDAAGTASTETRLAILSDCKRATLHQNGAVRAQAEFTAADLPTP